MNESIESYLRAEHPGTFKGWDGFELAIEARNRRGEEPIILVTLFNQDDEYVVAIHACFLLTGGDDGEEIIKVGEDDLALEYNRAYMP